MIIREISKEETIESIRQTLGLPSAELTVDETLIAGCVRRIAGFQCPCSVKSLVSSVLKSFKFLVEDEIEFKSQIEKIVERLVIGGDLLELGDVVTNDLEVKSTWIFAAHPAFIVRPGGIILILGIVPDEISPISSLCNRILYEGCKRYLIQNESEDLIATLSDLGLQQISESAWLKLPKKITPEEYIAEMNKKLSLVELSSDISGLQVLNTQTKTTYYKGRWTNSLDLTGYFVAKRPYLYGINIWCYVELQENELKRYIDIPFKVNGINQRGCDGGWHLQMAIDYCNGHPQVFNVRTQLKGEIIDFYSPIPLWAERRMIAIGQPVEPQNCLFSYLIPKADLPSEEIFLKQTLWLTRNP